MLDRERRVAALFLSLGVLLGAGSWLGLRAAVAEKSGVGSSETSLEVKAGFVVWESKRSGKWRLWRANLDGSGSRQLSRDDGERIHCCAHVAPDGKSIAWLSLDPGPDRYPREREPPQTGSLRVFASDGSSEREVAPRARTYGEHRAAVWRDRSRLIWIDGAGRTLERDLVSGGDTVLVTGELATAGWLLDPTLRTANQNVPSFSRYDGVRKAVVEMQAFGGCQPWVSADGLWGVWTAGAGGPLDAIEIATRKTRQLVAKNDPRLPEPQGYLYFPMLSTDRRYLAFAASNGGHDHWKADYDIHLAELDPNAMRVVGKIARLAPHPAPDRFPDVYASPSSRAPPPRTPRTPSPSPAPDRPLDASEHLLFQWRDAKAPNEVVDAALGRKRSFPVTPRGGARVDGRLRMQLGPGAFDASPDAAAAIVAGAQAANELSMEARVTPTRSPQAAGILMLGNQQTTNFALVQDGERLKLRLGLSLRGWVERDFDLGPLAASKETHVAWSYRSGRLQAWRDGKSVLDTAEARGDFFRWRPRPFVFGGDWSGTLEGISIWGRTLSGEGAGALAGRAPKAAALEAQLASARLVAKSPTPTLDEISPYREALAVYEYEPLHGSLERIRVAHWVRLDGAVLPVANRRIGQTYELRLEPFSAQPQLESIYLGDALEKSSAQLYFDVSVGAQ